MCEKEEFEIKFSPPLYRQRYLKVSEIISNDEKKISKVVDIGCAEMKVFPYLKRIRGINEIILMDIDYKLLKRLSHKVDPSIFDNLHKFEYPLSVSVICADAKFSHYPILNADVVTMIEFIEHLHEEDLSEVVNTLFGVICPRLVVVTTPNSDFNKFFASLACGKFRHYDHKFEFTKKEFENWCEKVTADFPSYSVTFSGCGEGPEDNNFCSQIGVFERDDSEVENRGNDSEGVEKKSNAKVETKDGLEASESVPCSGCVETEACNVVHSVVYPLDTRTTDEKFSDKVIEKLGNLRLWLRMFLSSQDFDKLYGETDLPDSPFCQDKVNVISQSSNVLVQNASKDEDRKPNSSSISPINTTQIVSIPEEEGESLTDDATFCSSSDEDSVAGPPINNPELVEVGGSHAPFIPFSENFKFKLQSDPTSIPQSNDADGIEDNNFYYSEVQESFIFTENTFCSWADLEPGEKIRNILSERGQDGMTFREVDSKATIEISFRQEDSEGEELNALYDSMNLFGTESVDLSTCDVSESQEEDLDI